MVTSVGGTSFLAMRPLLNEFTVTMPRGAAVVYPKDAAQILIERRHLPGRPGDRGRRRARVR